MSYVLEVFLVRQPTICRHCKLPIEPESLCTISLSPRGIVHISCFWPFNQGPINFSEDVRIAQGLSESHREETRQWVKNWNQRYLRKETNIPRQFLSKTVLGQCRAHRRPLLEIFSFLSTTDIEQLCAFVCKDWFHVSRDNELWKRKYILELSPIQTTGVADYRKKFVVRVLNSCWRCRQLKQVVELKSTRSFLQRPLCLECAGMVECRTISERELLRLNVSITTLKMLNLRCAEEQNAGEVIFIGELFKKLLPHCERRRRLLLRLISDACEGEVLRQVTAAVIDFDFKNAILRCRSIDWKSSAIMYFCGLNDKEKNNEDAICGFLQLMSLY